MLNGFGIPDVGEPGDVRLDSTVAVIVPSDFNLLVKSPKDSFLIV